MYDFGSDSAADAARVPARTLLADAEGVFLWPGIPLTEKRGGFIVPLPHRWVRYWTGRLHGAQPQDAAILSALATASKHLSWGFHAAAQSALDAAKLDRVSPDGAQLMRIVGARFGIVPPDMPPEKPPISRLRTAAIKSIAQWLVRRGITYLIPGVGEAVALVDAASWLYEYIPYISPYLSKPKTLEELQDLASQPEEGYQIHHIAEQTAAKNSGFPNSQIESAENKVRVPTVKHWEITNWYQTPNKDFKNLSPRDYLKDKDWSERQRVGQDALRLFGVLKP